MLCCGLRKGISHVEVLEVLWFFLPRGPDARVRGAETAKVERCAQMSVNAPFKALSQFAGCAGFENPGY